MTQPETQTARPLPRQLRKAALQVARFRTTLDWALALPAWEQAIGAGLQKLRIRAKRQGVSRATALRSLPIEQKQRLLKTLLSGRQLPRLCFAQTCRLARQNGLPFQSAGRTFDKLPPKRWDELRNKISLRLTARYQLYKDAQDEIFAHFYSLPSHCCSKLCSQPRLKDDALQEARLGLLEAIDRIDPEDNFEAYARQWIERRVRNFLMREQLPVKAPVNLISKSLRAESGGNERLAQAIREGIVQIDLLDQTEDAISHPNDAPEDSPDQIASENDQRRAIAAALLALTDKQRQVVEYRFGLSADPTPLSLAQVAERTGISRQQVFQREKRALQKLGTLLAPLREETLP